MVKRKVKRRDDRLGGLFEDVHELKSGESEWKPVIEHSLNDGLMKADELIKEQLRSKKKVVVALLGRPDHGKTEFSEGLRDRERPYLLGWADNPHDLTWPDNNDVLLIHCISPIEALKHIREKTGRDPDLKILVRVTDPKILTDRSKGEINLNVARQRIFEAQYLLEAEPDLIVNNNRPYIKT